MKLDNMTTNFGTALTVPKKEEEAKTVLKKLSGVYDEHAKLIFLFDVSASMNNLIAKSFTTQYTWTDEFMADVRIKTAAVVIRLNQLRNDPMALLMGGGLTPEEDKYANLTDVNPDENGNIAFTPKDDEEIKERIIRHNLIGVFNITVNWETKHEKLSQRIDLVKRLAKQELDNRFRKYPKSSIAVVPFGTFPTVMFDDGDPAQLQPAIEALNTHMCGGGTDILAAIKKGMDVCRAKPSKVGLHHFVIVSDGEDYRADTNIGSWLPALKASGVIMDYIHIGDSYTNTGLKLVCEALGGQFVTVNTEKDFESKFVEVINKPLLPPPA